MSIDRRVAKYGKAALARGNSTGVTADETKARFDSAMQSLQITFDGNNNVNSNGTNDDISALDALLDQAVLTTSNVVHAKLTLTNLPTTDPVSAGALWNDAGTVKISAG